MIQERSRAATPIERLVRPFQDFASLEASGGILLIGCTIAALLWTNSRWAASYLHFWHTEVTIGLGSARFSESLHFWINDGMMAVFFFLVGLEIKRQTLIGELASFKRVVLPIAAAIGGMLVPAGLYMLFNHGGPGARGWGIPVATDIAFALGVLALLGDRVPAPLKVFLAALAIVDDLGAVLIIALFYTATISWVSLAVAGGIFAALILLNRAGTREPLVYILLGIGLWIALLRSGVHPTVAGVLLAVTIPARERLDGPSFVASCERVLVELKSVEHEPDEIEKSANKSAALHLLNEDCAEAESLLLRFEHALNPWVKNLVMPVFALANAGVVLRGDAMNDLFHPVGLGILFGLILGKPIGIFGFAWLATWTGAAALPDRVNWRQVLGVGFLGGIGFTMSLFVANLAFDQALSLETAKIGILAASVVAGLAGAAVLLSRSR